MSNNDEGSISADMAALRHEVSNEIAMEEENLSLIGRHNERAQRLVPLLIGVLVVNAILLFILPHYPIYWIISSFLLYISSSCWCLPPVGSAPLRRRRKA